MALAGAQARLDVADAHALVEGGQRAGECRRGVALDQHPVRPRALDQVGEAAQAFGQHVREVLVVAHHAQVEVGLQAELVHQVVDHLAVLAGADDRDLELIGSRACRDDHRHQLDRLGPGPDDHRNSQRRGHQLAVIHRFRRVSRVLAISRQNIELVAR